MGYDHVGNRYWLTCDETMFIGVYQENMSKYSWQVVATNTFEIQQLVDHIKCGNMTALSSIVKIEKRSSFGRDTTNLTSLRNSLPTKKKIKRRYSSPTDDSSTEDEMYFKQTLTPTVSNLSESTGPFSPIKLAQIAEGNQVSCKKCVSDFNSALTLICEKCCGGWHLSCIIPELTTIPHNYWVCWDCREEMLTTRLTDMLNGIKHLVDIEIRFRRAAIQSMFSGHNDGDLSSFEFVPFVANHYENAALNILESANNPEIKCPEKGLEICVVDSDDEPLLNRLEQKPQLIEHEFQYAIPVHLHPFILKIDQVGLWAKHLKNLKKCAEERLTLLQRCRDKLSSSNNLLILYTSFIRPVLEVDCHIWYGWSATNNFHSLDKIQLRAIEIINDPTITNTLETLSFRRRVIVLTHFYRYMNGDCPAQIVHLLPPKMLKIQGKRNRMNQYAVEVCASYDKHFIASASLLWNSLPDTVFPKIFDVTKFRQNISFHFINTLET